MNLASRMMHLFYHMRGMGSVLPHHRAALKAMRPKPPLRLAAPPNLKIAEHVRKMHQIWQDARTQRAARAAVLGFFLAVTPFLTVVAGTNPAFAQAAGAVLATSVDLTSTANNVLALAIGALTVMAGILSKFTASWISSKTKMNDSAAEALLASRLNDIMLRGIDAADTYMKAQIADPNSPIKSYEFNSFFLAKAVEYVQDSADGILGYFGIDRRRLEEMLKARMSAFLHVPATDSGKLLPIAVPPQVTGN